MEQTLIERAVKAFLDGKRAGAQERATWANVGLSFEFADELHHWAVLRTPQAPPNRDVDHFVDSRRPSVSVSSSLGRAARLEALADGAEIDPGSAPRVSVPVRVHRAAAPW